MNKTIFVNAIKPNRINYDLDERSWSNTPRLVSLKQIGNKIPVCLYGLQDTELPIELLPSLGRMSDWASLCTSSFKMKDGFYPLLLDGKTLFFTDKEDYSLMDQYWAFDNIYKTQLQDRESPIFTPFISAKLEAEGWQQGIIDAQNIFVGELFGVVSNTIPLIKEFCSSNHLSNVEIIYSDRYVKNELTMIICLQLIKDLVAALQPLNYHVKMISSTFNDPNANDNFHRRLADSFISDTNRDETGRTLINDSNYDFISLPKEELPHYRELSVNIIKEGKKHVLHIMPDAGLGHWGLDIQKCKNLRQYFGINNGVNPGIPICSSTEQVYYVTQKTTDRLKN